MGDYDIPAYTVLALSPAPYLWQEDVFPEPMKFIPTRWDRNNMEKDTIASNPYTIMPFGKGKRMCIGSRLAEVEATALFCRLLQMCRVTVTSDLPVSLLDTRGGISRPVPQPQYIFEKITS